MTVEKIIEIAEVKLGSNLWELSDWLMIFLCSEIGL